MSATKEKPLHQKRHSHLSASHVKCQVCEMNGAGVHYGVITCYACKVFYHRNYHRGRMPICAKNGTCDVTGTARSICQGCRMSKCLSVGMSREASVRQGFTANTSPHTTGIESTLSSSLQEDILSAHGQHLPSIHYVNSTVIATVQHQYQKQQMMDRKLIRCVQQSCQEPVNTNGDSAQADLHVQGQMQSDFTAKEFENKILRFISYMKASPVFGEISTNDKSHLLKYGHIDFFILEDYPGFNTTLNVYCSSSLSCRPLQELNTLWGSEFVTEVVRFTQRLKKLNLTLKEIVFTELICILATDRCTLNEPDHVDAVKGEVVNILLMHLRATYRDPMRRFGKIVDMITDMRRLSEWYSNITRRLCQTSLSVQKSTLLMEMFNI